MPNKKKILFIITHLELGGAQKQLFSILQEWDKNNYYVCLYSGDLGYLKKNFLKLPDVVVRLEPALKREINFFLDAIVFFKLFLFIRKNKFDIVHTHSPKASMIGRWAAYFAGVKNIIYTVHGWPFHKFMNPFSYYSFLLIEKLTAKITCKIVVVSKADFDIGIEKKVASKNKLVLIHYGIDIDKFKNVSLKRKNTLSSLISILNISCLKHQKGITYFLKGAKAILTQKNDLEFFLIGNGYMRKGVCKIIKEYGIENNVFLKGWVDDISPFFSKAAILVLTSLWEGLPIVIIEAAIAGIPVVATDTEGVKDIIENYKNGIIIPPKNVKELIASVNEILDNYSVWVEKIKEYQQNINLSYWSQKRMVIETENIYKVL